MSGLITFFIQYDPKYVTTGSAEKSLLRSSQKVVFPSLPRLFLQWYRPLVVIIKKGSLRLFHIDVTFEM